MAGKRLRQILLCFLLTALLPSGELLADDIRFFGDWSYTTSLIEPKEEATKTESERFKQNYRLDVSKQLFPNLSVDGGAQVEILKTGDSLISPYVETELRTSLYSLSAGYREKYDRDKEDDGSHSRDYSRNYILRGEWRPVDLPRMDISYSHNDEDLGPGGSPDENSVLQINSRYDYRNFEFQYGFLRSDDRDTFDKDQPDSESQTTTHNARVRYRKSFWDNRVAVNASLRAEFTEQKANGEGSTFFSVSPSGNLFYYNKIDLINRSFEEYKDLTSSITLVKSPDTDANEANNIGLNFGEKVEVSRLQLYVEKLSDDQESDVKDSANWEIYVGSNRNIDEETLNIGSIEYDDSPPYTIKININSAAQHELIFLVYTGTQNFSVTSLQASSSRPNTNSAYSAQLGVGWQVTDKTKILYDLNLQKRESQLFDDQRVRMNNGLTVLHRINEVFSTSGRVSVSDTWEQSKHEASRYSYSAKLKARYLDTLSQALIYSGGLNQEAEGDSTTNSVLLHTTAELYRGLDVSFDQGYSWQSPVVGVDSSSFFIRIENRLVPHRRFNLTTDYSITWQQESGAETTRSNSARLRASWIPSDTLSLNGEVRMRVNERATDVFWEYGVSWLPLRDGTLHFNLSYSEEEDADGYRTRSLSPNISWDMTNYANLSVRYSQGEDKSDEFQTLFVNLKVYYD